MMYSRTGDDEWAIVEDVWHYTYDPESGRRIKKFVDVAGKPSGRELTYDGHNNVVEERIVSESGEPDRSYGYARIVFEYSDDGERHVIRERYFDFDGSPIKTVERGDS